VYVSIAGNTVLLCISVRISDYYVYLERYHSLHEIDFHIVGSVILIAVHVLSLFCGDAFEY